MTLDRVYKYIVEHKKNTLVFIKNDRVSCTQIDSKLAPTVQKNKCGSYKIIGVYTPKINMKFLEEDLLAMGIWE